MMDFTKYEDVYETHDLWALNLLFLIFVLLNLILLGVYLTFKKVTFTFFNFVFSPFS